MKTSDIINQVCSHLGITKSDMAKQMGLFPSSFYRKIANESMSLEELMKCVGEFGVGLSFDINYPDGETENSRINDEKLNDRLKIVEQELETEQNIVKFLKKALRELRTELNSAMGYVELTESHEDNWEYMRKLKLVHGSMDKTIAYSLGESYEEDEAIESVYSPENLEGKRVLLVDDNELNREILREILVDHGLKVKEAEDGARAIDLVVNNEAGYYSFILMDIEMPGVNGYEATSKIRKLPNRIRANTPIIALTANANANDREKASAVGMDDFLVKPVSTTRLLGCLAKYL
ncbi:MAG: response regulator [Lachnospiraceae bacterium]|nr:response regulator [Lachnospiraceae bacterium]